MLAPCGWDATPCEGCCTEALAALAPEVRAVLASAAVRILWAATGRQYGLCEKVLRPCRRNCGSYWGGLPTPARVNGEWLNIPCGTCAGSCGCSTVSEFTAENIDSVLGVTVDAEVLDPAEVVRVYDRRRVLRVDGEAWPACQDLNADAGMEGTWSVTVLQGLPAPEGGDVMAGILLCELAKACTGDDGCRLPQRLQSISRQGETMVFMDRFEGIDKMRTGLYEVDLWIESARTSIGRGPSISSVDRPRPSVLTWPVFEGSS